MLKRVLPCLVLMACGTGVAPSTTNNTELGRLSGGEATSGFTGSATRSDDTTVVANADGSFSLQHGGGSVASSGSAGSDQRWIEVRGHASEVLLEPFDDLLRLVFANSPVRDSDSDNDSDDDDDDDGDDNRGDGDGDGNGNGNGGDDDDRDDGDRRGAYFGCTGTRVVRVEYVLADDKLIIAPWAMAADGSLSSTITLGCLDAAGALISETELAVTVASLAPKTSITIAMVRDGAASELRFDARVERDDDGSGELEVAVGDDDVLEIVPVAATVYADDDGLFTLR